MFQIKKNDDLKLLIETAGLKNSEEDLVAVNEALNAYSKYVHESIDEYDGRIVNLDNIIRLLDEKHNDDGLKIDELRKLTEGNEQKEILEQIKLLEAKKALVENYSIIESNINSLKEIHTLQQAEKKTNTNRITA